MWLAIPRRGISVTSCAQMGIANFLRRKAKLTSVLSPREEIKLYDDLTLSFRNQLQKTQQFEQIYGQLLLSSLQRLNLSVVDHQQLLQILQKSAESSDSIANKLDHSEPESTFQSSLPNLYEIMTRVKSATPDEYALTIQISAKHDSLNTAERLYGLSQERLRTSSGLASYVNICDPHNAIMEAYLLHNKASKALNIYYNMPASIRSSQTYTILLHGLRKRGKISEALAVYEDMRTMGMDPFEIHGVNSSPLQSEPGQLFREHTSIILLLSRANDVARMEQIWHAYQQDKFPFGLRLGVSGWSALWRTFALNNFLIEALEVQQKMQTHKFVLISQACVDVVKVLCEEIRQDCNQISNNIASTEISKMFAVPTKIMNSWKVVKVVFDYDTALPEESYVTLLRAACATIVCPLPQFDNIQLFDQVSLSSSTIHANRTIQERSHSNNTPLAALARVKLLSESLLSTDNDHTITSKTSFSHPLSLKDGSTMRTPLQHRLEQLLALYNSYFARSPSPNVSLAVGLVSDAITQAVALYEDKINFEFASHHTFSPSLLYQRHVNLRNNVISLICEHVNNMTHVEKLLSTTLLKYQQRQSKVQVDEKYSGIAWR